MLYIMTITHDGSLVCFEDIVILALIVTDNNGLMVRINIYVYAEDLGLSICKSMYTIATEFEEDVVVVDIAEITVVFDYPWMS